MPLRSNLVQNPEQSNPESLSEVPFVIPSNSKPRKSFKIKRPNKKSAKQNNEPIQNPDLTQPSICSRNSISIKATPAALEELPCESQNPTKKKLSNSKRKQNKQETEETLQEQNPEIRDFLLKHWPCIRSYTHLGPVQDIFNFHYNRMFRNFVDKILNKIIEKQKNRFKINLVLALFCEILKPKVTDTITVATIMLKFLTELFSQAIVPIWLIS